MYIHHPKKIRIKDLTLIPQSKEVFRQDQKITLRNKEFLILELFMRHPNVVLNRQILAERIWKDKYIKPELLNVYISNLRRKIDKNFTPKLIKTAHCVGYKLDGEI